MQRRALLHAGVLAAAAVLIIVVFHLGGADRAVTAFFYDAGQRVFPLKDAWLLAVAGHTGMKWSMLGFWILCLSLGGPLRRGGLYMAAIVAAVLALKHFSPYSCPWDLTEYGGSKPLDGRCLPAAHPLSGFALFGLAFALQDTPRRARIAFAAACVIGLLAGAVQVARGAHFASHVLWTAWVSWGVTLLLAAVPRRPRA